MARTRVEAANTDGGITKAGITKGQKKRVDEKKRSEDKQKRNDREEVDAMMKSIEEEEQEKVPSQEKMTFTSVLRSGSVKVLVGVLMLGLLFVLKSGEETYHSMVSSAQTSEVDPYEVLGVARTAKKAEIRKAHRALSLLWHPDKREEGCDDECRQTFKQINEAYKLLIDDARRQLYDQTQKVSSGSSHVFFTTLNPAEYLFTPEAWKLIVAPSLDHRQLWTPPHVSGTWAFLIADPRSQLTEHLVPMWTELAHRFHGRVTMMRIDANDPHAKKMLPVKIAITPAIMMISSGGVPVLYDKMHSFQPRNLVAWINSNIPSPFRNAPNLSKEDLTNMLEQTTSNSGSLGRLPAIYISEDREPPKLVDAVAQRLSSVFDWIKTSNVHLLDDLPDLPKFKRSTKAVILTPGMQVIQVPSGWWKLDKIDLRTTSNADENPSAEAHAELLEQLRKVIRVNEVPVYEESLPFLCPPQTEEEEHVVCDIRINPQDPLPNTVAASRRKLVVDVITAKQDKDVDVRGVDEYEDDGLDEQPDEKESAVTVQMLRLDTTPLSAYGSSLVNRLQNNPTADRIVVDATAGTYQPDKATEWLPLPHVCNSALGHDTRKSWISSLFGPSKPHCMPRMTLDTRKTIYFWCATHRAITFCIFLATLGGYWLLPKRKTVHVVSDTDTKED